MGVEPCVAVLVAAYNAEATIARAVRSALAQPEVAEVCVIDDASSDDTVAVARACDDGTGRLTVLRQARNAGPSAARNAGLAGAKAPWVCVLDADDFLLPGRMAGLLSHSGTADLIADDLLQAREGAENQMQPMWDDKPFAPQPIDFEAFILANVTREGVHRKELGFLKPLMRRALLDAHAIRYREEMRLGEDYELYARALAHGARLLLVPAQGYVSVVREGSLSGRHSEADLLALRDCDLGLARIRPLTPGERWALAAHYVSVDRKLQWRLLIAAVKARNPAAAARTFLRSPQVSAYLTARLLEQAWRRGTGRGPHGI
jgi:succinoglycan biosynthesis protein ExoU